MRLTQLRQRGRSRRLDSIGGLAIEPGDAEGLLAELGRVDDVAAEPGELLSAGVAAFDHAARCFELTSLERDILLLALAPEIDARFCRVFGFLNDSVVALRPTVGLAISMLAQDSSAGLSAFVPTATLMKLGLISIDGDTPLAARAIRAAPDVWPRLAGVRPALARRHRRAPAAFGSETLFALEAAVHSIREGHRPLVLVCGETAAAAVHAVADRIGVAIALQRTTALDPDQRAAVVRDALWEGAALIVDPTVGADALTDLLHDAPVSVIVPVGGDAVPSVFATSDREIFIIPTATLCVASRIAVWRQYGADSIGIDVAALATRFRFGEERVAAVMKVARARARSRGHEQPGQQDVLDACRAIGGPATTTLAHRLSTTFQHEDLIVTQSTRTELALFETAARHGHTLFGPGTRGGAMRSNGGFVAMFSGRPGTGKTLAAQIIARSLQSELLRIDLSQVVDKYIGETEKRLDTVFREAEVSGALLFFDEADALFGKRTEVKDAHDRYSNIETAFLLQRLEQYPGIAILATNLANNLDSAFMRRLHFVVEFPMPGPAERQLIWERHLRECPVDDDVDLAFLSRFELAGGDIRNAAIAAVLLGHDEPRIAMRHLVLATSRELRKAGRLAQPDQFGRWKDDVLSHLRGTPRPPSREAPAS